MRQSQLFSKTQKTSPKDEEAINAKLLMRGGFIRKLSAGVYSLLPLGWRVLSKVNQIIREEMSAIGAEELLMNSLVAKEYWEKSGRWNVDVVYKIGEEQGAQYGLGWTHEEVVSHLAGDFLQSYKDLPKAVYQIQTKFRNEPRAKNGLLRGREFMMKDLYSFHATKEDLDKYYQTVIGAYKKIMKRLSLKAKVVEAAGGAFTKEYTHEFQVLSSAGEDVISHCEKCDFAQNKEIARVKAGDKCPECGANIQEAKGIEVANVFRLGTKYSDAYNLKFKDEKGASQPVIMGSYGIGPTRLVGTLVEIFNDERGILWPEAVAPFKVHLIGIMNQESGIRKKSEKVYANLQKAGIEVLYDERDASAGEKFGDSDLLGIPYRAVISEKAGEKIELKKRSSKELKLVTEKELLKLLTAND